MYISYHTLNFSQFSPENFDFFGTPSYWYFLISSFPWQFLTRRKKPHAISINTERVRSPRVQTFWWHSSNRDVRPGEFQPYEAQGVSFFLKNKRYLHSLHVIAHDVLYKKSCLFGFCKMTFTIHLIFTFLAGIIFRPLFTTFCSYFCYHLSGKKIAVFRAKYMVLHLKFDEFVFQEKIF